MLSNAQFRPRRIGSANANVPSGAKTMKVPRKTTSNGQLISIKRNARSGNSYHRAGSAF
jgi:hypothetical protein